LNDYNKFISRGGYLTVKRDVLPNRNIPADENGISTEGNMEDSAIVLSDSTDSASETDYSSPGICSDGNL
jgi:hypothetical protein